ncbi:MAG: Holliday junction resolvase RuvX [Akkermansiaceae bacterium]|nr:Holliday junction resolvase RuvX [Akkermansiaceae bacterium]
MATHPALGIDYGDVRIGIAATDDFGILAHPVETIDVTRVEPLGRIAEIAAARGIRTLVVGLPLRMDGSEGTAAEKVRQFAAALGRRLPDLPVVLVDETLTTAEAAAKLRQAGRKAKHQRAIIDQAAAVEILSQWIGDRGSEIEDRR